MNKYNDSLKKIPRIVIAKFVIHNTQSYLNIGYYAFARVYKASSTFHMYINSILFMHVHMYICTYVPIYTL